MFSLGKKVWIEDCHGAPLYLMQVESLFQAIVDGLTFDVSLVLWNADESAVVGYVKGKKFWDDNFELVDAATGTTSATMTRDRTTLSWWQWKMNVSGVVACVLLFISIVTSVAFLALCADCECLLGKCGSSRPRSCCWGALVRRWRRHVQLALLWPW